jgi:ParB family chromosome partitioning protein
VASSGLSVRETERLVRGRRRLSAKSSKTKKPAPSASARALVEELQRALGTKVRLEDRGGAGTLAIDFFSYADLERIVRLLRR